MCLLLSLSTIAAASDGPGASKEEGSTAINTKNWARGAIGYGFFFVPFIQSIGYAADGTRACISFLPGHSGPGYCITFPELVIPNTVILLASPPIIAAGAASARKDHKGIGFPGVRKAGWVLYGIAAAMSVPLTVIALYPTICHLCPSPYLPVGPTSIMTVFAALSGMLLTIDGMGSLRHLQALQDGLTPEEIPTMRAAPFITPISGGIVAGLGGTF